MQGISKLTEQLDGAHIAYSLREPMSAHTSFRIGGPAALFVRPSGAPQLGEVWRLTAGLGLPRLIIGNGSNLLVSDAGLERVVVCPQREPDGGFSRRGDRAEASAGEPLSAFCLWCARAGLSGLEFAYGIPGTVGGAVFMNAGAYGGEIKDVLLSVEYFDEAGAPQRAAADSLELSYRRSAFSGRDCAVSRAAFALHPGDPTEILRRMEELKSRRQEKQPLEFPSAGSAFKRPEGAFAAALIDQCGLKGLTVGGAQVSEKHAGFIVNRGGATCADVLELIARVQRAVKEKTGFALEPEIRIVS